MKIIFSLLLLFLFSSCGSSIDKEALKTNKANSASSRINASESNSSNIFKELDE